MSTHTDVKITLDSLPSKPGVYVFRDIKKRVLYVGKAKRLTSRVRSYFQKSRTLGPSKETMLNDIASIETIVTPSETDALILEATLIKKYQPPYNIVLKDDKFFLYIRITLSDEFPTVDLVRSVSKKTDTYFGPYTSAYAVRETMKTLKRIFKFRTCVPHQGSPCFDYTIGRCLGPCVDAISEDAYRDMIHDLMRFLRGKDEEVLRELTQRMQLAAQHKQFEYAATLRDRMNAIKKIARKQTMIAQKPFAFDVLAVAKEKRTAAVTLLQIRDRKLINKQSVILSNKPNENEREILEAFIVQYYTQSVDTPHDIFVELLPHDTALIERTFHVRVHRPSRGAKAALVHTAHDNAVQALTSYFASFEKDTRLHEKILRGIQTFFSLPRYPKRIECFDVANIQGSHSVGSMVVFLDGKSVPSLYKRFIIKTVHGSNDPAMIAELVSRRLARWQKNEQGWERPDLIVVDGGKGQLSGIKKLPGITSGEVPVLALAKGGHAKPTEQSSRERFYDQSLHEFTLPSTSRELYFLERIRDEAHRFAITFYRKKHQTSTTKSRLDTVPGIGVKRRNDLLRHFGSVDRIEAASEEEIARVVGKKAARAIQMHLLR